MDSGTQLAKQNTFQRSKRKSRKSNTVRAVPLLRQKLRLRFAGQSQKMSRASGVEPRCAYHCRTRLTTQSGSLPQGFSNPILHKDHWHEGDLLGTASPSPPTLRRCKNQKVLTTSVRCPTGYLSCHSQSDVIETLLSILHFRHGKLHRTTSRKLLLPPPSRPPPSKIEHGPHRPRTRTTSRQQLTASPLQTAQGYALHLRQRQLAARPEGAPAAPSRGGAAPARPRERRRRAASARPQCAARRGPRHGPRRCPPPPSAARGGRHPRAPSHSASTTSQSLPAATPGWPP
mmetsp:Transcript_28899/g.69042  ORF Transcript_28899/g.69042 Transcript_28899/m.69042 type:complete len:288 (-) Transcript_28899:2235-3098(-)